MITRIAILALALLVAPSVAFAICIPFPCHGCELLSAGQLNFVVRDAETGTITLIPNIRIQGTADDFALVVPTPTEPALVSVPAEVWDDVLELTRPLPRERDRSSCSSNDLVIPSAEGDGFGRDGVDVIGSQVVGAFQATLVRSDDPGALAAWLQDNGYGIGPEESALLAPYVDRDWVFTAMKLDPDQVVIPDRWDANVDPVSFTYASDGFEVPLPLLSIRRTPFLPVEVFVVDDHRSALPGFTTRYANRLSASEVEAVRDRHPSLAPYVTRGRFLTRLHRDFGPGDEMRGSPEVTRARTDEEFRWTGWAAIPIELLLAGAALGWGRRRARRTADPASSRDG